MHNGQAEARRDREDDLGYELVDVDSEGSRYQELSQKREGVETRALKQESQNTEDDRTGKDCYQENHYRLVRSVVVAVENHED